MGFQNIKYGRLYLPRWTFSAHTFCCTSTKALQSPESTAVVSAFMALQPSQLECSSVMLSWPAGSFSSSRFCPAASGTQARPPAARHSRGVVILSAPAPFLFEIQSQNRLQGSFICDSLGLGLTSEHGSPLCFSPPQRILECIRL